MNTYIDILINDINRAWYSGAYYSALTSLLTIPDLCGKALYPESTTGQRYMQWLADYMFTIEDFKVLKSYKKSYKFKDDKERNDFHTYEDVHEQLFILYRLRCSILHSGMLFEDLYNKDDFIFDKELSYKLVWDDFSDSPCIRGSFGGVVYNDNLTQIVEITETNVEYEINIKFLHKYFLKYVDECYSSHMTKFNFLNKDDLANITHSNNIKIF